MNPWALDKDDAIKAVLLMLAQRLGTEALCLAPQQPPDQRAVRLYRPEHPALGAYLYTYGQRDGRCGIHLEYPRLPDAFSAAIEVYEDLDIDALAAILQVHLELH